MITIMLKGGLGNQMFQYALGRALGEKYSTYLVLDTTLYTTELHHEDKRSFALDAFAIKATIADKEDNVRKAKAFVFKILWRIRAGFWHEQATHFYPSVFSLTHENSVLEGYWHSEKYFSSIKDLLRTEFVLTKELEPYATSLASLITQSETRNETPISISVRRGDYTWSPSVKNLAGVCTPEYYARAVQTLIGALPGKQFHYFINSEDVPWVKEHIVPLLKGSAVTIIDPTKIKDYEQLILISKCHHHIIANSTFSWWGAWLNSRKDKLVITPKQWSIAKSKSEDINLENWVGV